MDNDPLIRKAKPAYKVTKYLEKLIENEEGVRKQFVPSDEERDESEGEADPLAEEDNVAVSKAIHKYPNRLLVYCTNVCFSNCRYCVRRNLIKRRESIITEKEVDRVVEYLKDHPEINDVVLSGGDPLTLSNKQLKYILFSIRSVLSVQVIRIGSRAPVVFPKRVTAQLINMLSKFSPIFMNLHINTTQELTNDVRKACDLLSEGGIILGSQSVLLKNINDSKEVLAGLFQKCLEFRIRPYYLYSCDRVVGTKHFWVDEEVGLKIMDYLHKTISGLAIPRFVRDTKERKVILD